MVKEKALASVQKVMLYYQSVYCFVWIDTLHRGVDRPSL